MHVTGLRSDQVSGLLIDLDGVLYVGESPIDRGVDAIAWLLGQDIPHLFLTNTTSRPIAAIVAKLSRMGIEIPEHKILTPVLATNQWLAAQQITKVALFVPQSTAVDFQLYPATDADKEVEAVVIGDLGYQWDYELLNKAFRRLMNNSSCQLIALGMTKYWRDENGLRLDVAPFVKALEFAANRKAKILGKPSKLLFRQACAHLGLDTDRVLMIGDDIQNDVYAAQLAGLHGCLVKTGKFMASDMSSVIEPDLIFPSIASLPDWWNSETGRV